VEDGSIITVTSTGGDPDTSEIAAEIIQSKQLSILVQSACISSCVEYLIPAATNMLPVLPCKVSTKLGAHHYVILKIISKNTKSCKMGREMILVSMLRLKKQYQG